MDIVENYYFNIATIVAVITFLIFSCIAAEHHAKYNDCFMYWWAPTISFIMGAAWIGILPIIIFTLISYCIGQCYRYMVKLINARRNPS